MKQWQPVQIPLGVGLAQKDDARALNAPSLAIAVNCEFEEAGGLQTRKPYTAVGLDYSKGTLDDTTTRRIVSNGDERLLFTKDQLFSWDPYTSKWMERGTHLAAAVDEESRFNTTGDQVMADRAELNGIVFVTWHEYRSGVAHGYLAAYNAVTGAVTYQPQEIGAFGNMRLTALNTRVVLSYQDGTGYFAYIIDPAAPSLPFVGSPTTLWVQPGGTGYDVVQMPGLDMAMFAMGSNGGSSYRVTSLTAGGSTGFSAKARAAGVISLSISPGSAFIQIVRRNTTTTVQGDKLDAGTLADVTTGQAIGSSAVTITQIASAYRTTLDGSAYRCYAFWNSTGGDTVVNVVSNWVDTAGAIGTAAQFMSALDVNSRAFGRDGDVYVWLGFSQVSTLKTDADSQQFSYALQNTYFLYRHDGFLVAKAATSRAAGPSYNSSWLPGVQSLGGDRYAWAGGTKRIIDIGGAGKRRSSYAARAPREIFVTFDDNRARRCARLGNTLYITGGEVKQYDGVQLTEVGFHIFPWFLEAFQVGGVLPDVGKYAYKMTPRWDNASGEVERGTTATTIVWDHVSAVKSVALNGRYITPTHKTNRPISIEVWRTVPSPTADAPFYLVSDKDPAVVYPTSNAYITNDVIAAGLPQLEDVLTNADLTTHETSPENGSTLENIAPPPATIIAATSERIFLAGIAGDPDRVWYSKQRNDGEVAGFNEALTIAIPRQGGAITALAFLNETLVVFRERAVYSLPGDGFDNTGNGQNYGPARILSLDVGAESHEAVALAPMGLVFDATKGKFIVGRGGDVQYIGSAVANYDNEPVKAVHVVESQHQIRWVTANRTLVHDYVAVTQQSPSGQWAEWTVAGIDAALWNNTHVVLSADAGPIEQRTDYTGIDYGMDVETAWIKLNDLQGAGSVRWLDILGEYRGLHGLRVRLARDYQQDGAGAWTYYQDETWTPTPAVIGSGEQVSVGPRIPKCVAIKVRMTVTALPTWSEALKLSGLAFEVGIDQHINRRLATANKI